MRVESFGKKQQDVALEKHRNGFIWCEWGQMNELFNPW